MRLLRCCLVLVAATAAMTAALRLLAPSIPPAPGFEGTLVSGCAVVACLCAVWGWLGCVAVVVEALRVPGRTATRPTMPGVPPALRRLVLAGCGVALTAAAAPAMATSGGDAQQGLPAVVAGLPFPSRAMDLPARAERVVVVRPGDSLWAIAARHLPQDCSDAEITAGWQQLYARNRAVVGDDPSLIHPGQRLSLPDHLEES